MTGFGRGEKEGTGKKFVVEIKSVNHRYSEIVVKLPRQYNLLEEHIRHLVQKCIKRGRVDVFVKEYEIGESNSKIQVDKELAMHYYKFLKDLADNMNISSNISIFELVNLPDVIKNEEVEENLDEVKVILSEAVQQALEQLILMRKQEGEQLYNDLKNRINIIMKIHEKISQKSPVVVEEYRERLHKRTVELLKEQYDENRFAQEVLYFAEKSNITEELVRLKSHFEQFLNTLNSTGAVGRKLDFIVQEMNRETNTIGSKANDLEIAHFVVEIKTEIEKIREQVQNIE